MHINAQTFDALLRARSINQTELAQKAKLGVKTIGRIKRGAELRQANVERIAAALEVDVKTLQAPPREDLVSKAEKKSGMERLVVDVDATTINNLWLISNYYKLPVRALIQFAPLLFSIVAEAALNERRKRLEDWRRSFEPLLKDAPHNVASELNVLHDDLLDLYWSEMSALEARDLTGDASGPYTTEPSHRCVGEVESHQFFEFLERLAADHGQYLEFFSSKIDDIVYNHGGLTSNIGRDGAREVLVPPDMNRSNEVGFAIDSGSVLIRDIPAELMAPEKAEERVRWIEAAAGDGRE